MGNKYKYLSSNNCKFCKLQFFRKRFEIFQKFQNWDIGNKNILEVYVLALGDKMLCLEAMNLCPEYGYFNHCVSLIFLSWGM